MQRTRGSPSMQLRCVCEGERVHAETRRGGEVPRTTAISEVTLPCGAELEREGSEMGHEVVIYGVIPGPMYAGDDCDPMRLPVGSWEQVCA